MEQALCVLVNRVVDCLDTEECKKLLYLCWDWLSAECVEDCRGALITLITHTHTHQGRPPPGDTLLKEILFRLNRFDILKRILGTSRQEVEEMLRASGRVLSDYRVLMVELNDNLEAEDLRSLNFLLSSTVSKGPLDRATSFLDVVAELEKIDKVSCEKVEVVEGCLRRIGRVDLARRIQSYQKGQNSAEKEVSQSPAQVGVGSQSPERKQQRQSAEIQTLKFSVPESGAQHTQASVDEYYINPEFRGMCVIIDCVGCDGEVLKDTFEQLSFRVDLHTLLGVGEVYSLLQSAGQQGVLQRFSAFCCCLLSRGSDTHLLATDAEGPGLALADLRHLFSPVRCPLLAGKPKLFFMQSYAEAPPTPQTQDDPYLETDGLPPHIATRQTSVWKTLPAAADILWSSCKTEAWLLEKQGHHSVYLQALSSALLRGRQRRLPLLDALLDVNRDVFEHNRRNPDRVYHLTLFHTLRRSVFL
ncbi:CASP8 and FADD-like apoptosis regulator a [Salminus brasiliensis]|uniref:CASP8 and FADD-like apoptosis regulator a n=1 Tax=Salminus brasiliensis TaxID=930266 RepID=UPI003B8378EF